MEVMLLLSFMLLVGSIVYVGWWILLVDHSVKHWWYWAMMTYGMIAVVSSYIVGCVGLYLYW